MDRIQADYDALGDIKRAFEQEANGVDTLTKHVRASMDELESGGWTGLGANAFFGEMRDLVFPGLERLSRVLCEAGQVVEQISTLVQHAEETAANLFRGRRELGDMAVLRGTETELTPLEKVARDIWNLSPDHPPRMYLEQALPDAVAHMQNTPAGQNLIRAAEVSGVCFVMPDGTRLGDVNGVEVYVEIDDQMDYAGGLFDAGDLTTPDDDIVYMSAHPDAFNFGTPHVAGTLSHEMKHAIDQHNGLLTTRGFDPTSTHIPTLEADIREMVRIRVEGEVRAHGVGYAVRDGGAFFDDGVLDVQEKHYILETRGYADQYAAEINEAFAAEYAANPAGGLRHADIELDPYGNIAVTVITLVEPT